MGSHGVPDEMFCRSIVSSQRSADWRMDDIDALHPFTCVILVVDKRYFSNGPLTSSSPSRIISLPRANTVRTCKSLFQATRSASAIGATQPLRALNFKTRAGVLVTGHSIWSNVRSHSLTAERHSSV